MAVLFLTEGQGASHFIAYSRFNKFIKFCEIIPTFLFPTTGLYFRSSLFQHLVQLTGEVKFY